MSTLPYGRLKVVTSLMAVVGAMACGWPVGFGIDSPRYLTTEKPLDIGDTILCFAVDPNDRQGLWQWGAGPDGCASRSTGPGVFRGEDASVSVTGDVVEARFRLRMIRLPDSPRPEIITVVLILANGEFRSVESGAVVPISRRADLDIPEAWR